MIFKTPEFWYRKPQTSGPLTEHFLRPLSLLYKAGYAIDQSRATPKAVDIPVLCVGNIVAGGAGKTITAQSIMNLIQDKQLCDAPHFLTRGYGGTLSGPLKITPRHSYKECGDEALLLAQRAPVIMSKNRYDGAVMAQNAGADVVIMDDGLQNTTLKKDITFIVINADMGFGNARLLPAGPLREPLATGLQKADAFIVIGDDTDELSDMLPQDTPVFHAAFTTQENALPDKAMTYLAFAGLGYPQKFFAYLSEDLGYTLTDTTSFADHYSYTQHDIESLHAHAKAQGAALITTEKDIMRIPGALRDGIHVLPAALKWADESALIAFLKTSLADVKGHQSS